MKRKQATMNILKARKEKQTTMNILKARKENKLLWVYKMHENKQIWENKTGENKIGENEIKKIANCYLSKLHIHLKTLKVEN